jgi:hypothetical protein
MDKKLTLSLNKDIIEMAKRYAEANQISLSKLIESYLGSLTKQDTKPNKITPLVESLSGVISIDEDFDEKEEYANFLMKKYK